MRSMRMALRSVILRDIDRIMRSAKHYLPLTMRSVDRNLRSQRVEASRVGLERIDERLAVQVMRGEALERLWDAYDLAAAAEDIDQMLDLTAAIVRLQKPAAFRRDTGQT